MAAIFCSLSDLLIKLEDLQVVDAVVDVDLAATVFVVALPSSKTFGGGRSKGVGSDLLADERRRPAGWDAEACDVQEGGTLIRATAACGRLTSTGLLGGGSLARLFASNAMLTARNRPLFKAIAISP